MVSVRAFARTDRERLQPVVVVNRTFTERCWPRGMALGEHRKLPIDKQWKTIVRVVNDAKQDSLGEPPRLEMFVPYTQKPCPAMQTTQFIVQTKLDAASARETIAGAIAAVDANLPVAPPRRVDSIVRESVTPARFSMLLLSCFDMLAVVMTGLAAGTLAALVALRAMRSLRFGISVADPLAYALSLTVLAVVAASACRLRARRVLRVAPATTLRGGQPRSSATRWLTLLMRSLRVRSMRSARVDYRDGIHHQVKGSHYEASLIPFDEVRVFPRDFPQLAAFHAWFARGLRQRNLQPSSPPAHSRSLD